MTCTACNRFFHTNCHSPSVATPPENGEKSVWAFISNKWHFRCFWSHCKICLLAGWKCSGCEPRVSTAAFNKTAEDEKARKKLKAEKRQLRLLKATEKAKAKEATSKENDTLDILRTSKLIISAEREIYSRTIPGKVVIPAILDKPLLRRKEDVTSKNDEQAEKQLKKLKREQKRNMKTLMKSSSREDSWYVKSSNNFSGFYYLILSLSSSPGFCSYLLFIFLWQFGRRKWRRFGQWK